MLKLVEEKLVISKSNLEGIDVILDTAQPADTRNTIYVQKDILTI
jgi:hypothetical protein